MVHVFVEHRRPRFVLLLLLPAPMPHLSMYLSVSPARREWRGLPFRWARMAPLSRCSGYTVLLPESFRGGCSVGVVAGRSLPCCMVEQCDLTEPKRTRQAPTFRATIHRGFSPPSGRRAAQPGRNLFGSIRS